MASFEYGALKNIGTDFLRVKEFLEDRKDAERYRWLRQNHVLILAPCYWGREDNLDKFIDGKIIEEEEEQLWEAK